MSKIHVLPRQVADLIAAGEVVERPASVVKELLENAIDAGATRVVAEIRGGGSSFIRISDDGCGMEKTEVPVAFMRHATSKIETGEDLEAISTLGFRGEALAAIAAVARIDVMTCVKEALSGTRAHIEGGEVTSLAEAGCPPGTTMVVRDIYFNTPARMKFLKRDATEAGFIEETAQKIALSHPEVAVQFIKDGKLVFSTPGKGDLKEVIFEIFGAEIADSLIECAYKNGGIEVRGFAGKPHLARHNRNLQLFFLNGRTIRSKTFFAAVDEAYRERLMTKKYPSVFLHIAVDPSLVDINVHPAKLEAKFTREKEVYDAVYFAVMGGLDRDTSRPVADGAVKKLQPVATPFGEAVVPVPAGAAEESPAFLQQTIAQIGRAAGEKAETVLPPLPWSYSEKTGKRTLSGFDYRYEGGAAPGPIPPEAALTAPGREKPADFPPPEIAPVRLVGEVFDTYVIAQLKDEIYIVDKHAAHERYLYERLKGTFGDSATQLFLDPAVVTVTALELDLFLSHPEVFAEAGFLIEEFGKGALLVRGVPAALAQCDVSDVIGEMLSELAKTRFEVRSKSLDRILYSAACKAAVKAGQKSGREEMEALIALLFTHTDIKSCPHGRPVAVVLTKYGIEKQFGRIV